MDFLWDFVCGGQVVLFIYGRLCMESTDESSELK